MLHDVHEHLVAHSNPQVEFDVVKGDKGEQAVNISGPGGAPLDREYYRSE